MTMRRWARFSRDRTHRYVLGRSWEQTQGDLLSGWDAPSQGTVVFVMLNPSRASHLIDDPTLRRCIAFAKQWGFGRVELVNMFSIVTPYPEQLLTTEAPNGPRNNGWLRRTVGKADRVVCAWGAHGEFQARAEEVLTLLRASGKPLMHLGLTREGHPRHPLYLPSTTKPEVWRV